MSRLPLFLILAALTIAPLAAAEYYEGKPECPPDHMCTTSMPSDGSEWSCADGQMCTTSVDNGCTAGGSGETTPADGGEGSSGSSEGSTGSGEATPSDGATEPAKSEETSIDPAPAEREPQPENESAPVKEEEPVSDENATREPPADGDAPVSSDDGQEPQYCTTTTGSSPEEKSNSTEDGQWSGCSQEIQCLGAPASGTNDDSANPQEEREATGNQPPAENTAANDVDTTTGAGDNTQAPGTDQTQKAADTTPADAKTVPGAGVAAAVAALGAALLVMRRRA